ncbi:hypothetical protein HNP71_001290 [Acidocella aromatica]|uniref:Uncharacterized protein n=1 Tax=Acidocella aromatica TaxID=1303579 RepID=A0A840VRZ5_9PROT|nr:hypothetical protein [Acidocella aromatica]
MTQIASVTLMQNGEARPVIDAIMQIIPVYAC